MMFDRLRQADERYSRFQPFKEYEAWAMFRIAAIAEAVGWTLLITGIVLKRTVFNGNNAPVAVSGRIHGTFFIVYIAACLVLYPSLRWSFGRALVAGLASVPPYGSLVMEQWEGRRRLARHGRQQLHFAVYRTLATNQI